MNLEEDLNTLLTLYNENNLDEAMQLSTELESSYSQEPVFLNLEGAIYARANLVDRAKSYYEKAISIAPNFAEAHNNLGTLHKKMGDIQTAERCYQTAVSINPSHHQALFNLGNLYKQSKNYEAALKSYTLALEYDVKNVRVMCNLGNTYFSMGDYENAEIYLLRALGLKPDYVEALLNLGNVYVLQGNNTAAKSPLEKALALSPENPHVHSLLGNVFRDLGRHDQAMRYHNNAIALGIDAAESHRNICLSLVALSRMDQAKTEIEKAIELDPNNPVYLHTYCDLLEKGSHLSELEEELQAIEKKISEKYPPLEILKARMLHRTGRLNEAISTLERLDLGRWDTASLASRDELLGDLYDRTGEYAKAFRKFESANSFHSSIQGSNRYHAEIFLENIVKLRESFSQEKVSQWSSSTLPEVFNSPVFLVGFPRSGTTLLDTILRSHSQVSVAEEIAATSEMLMVADSIKLSFSSPDNAAIDLVREKYFEVLAQHIPLDEGGIWIDKLPLNILNVGPLHRIFPQSKFVIALRHPCDCVLSCVMKSFQLNNAMANFLTLEHAARAYDKVMSLWLHYQSTLDLEIVESRYENLIQDLQGTSSPVLEFLGLQWENSLDDYVETARNRGRIRTPSYTQVTQPLYTRARGRWENYREQMEPVLPVLLKWADHWGYERPEWATHY